MTSAAPHLSRPLSARWRRFAFATLAALSALVTGCGEADPNTPANSEVLRIPAGFPRPVIPADNPVTAAKAELGRYLFYDRRLSGNETQSCGSCHQQRRAFTDGRATALGSTGMMHHRSSMALTNVAYYSVLTWANPLMRTLERQALVPMFGTDPVELGLAGMDEALLARLRADARYPGMFRAAFPEARDPISLDSITRAIATFERTLISGDSPYDRFLRGDRGALSPAALRGKDLFFGERLECYHCHGGFNFANSVTFEGLQFDETTFHNTGLYNVDGRGAYPSSDTGLMGATNRPEDMGKFRSPSLRNVELTAPYMHDGSVATLEEALDHYAAGGRRIAAGPNAGDGHTSPLRDGFIAGFTLSASERADVVEFLRALTDRNFINDPRFSDPFGRE
jgi:cytochrome c peroxidase